jgi:signal transduction histidine kinase
MENPFSSPFYIYSPLVALAVSFILIFIVISWGRRSSGSWIFVGLLLSVGIWGFLLFGMRSSPDIENAVIWSKIASIPATGTFVLYYHFTIAYTGARKQKGFLIAAYLFLLTISALSPTGLIIKGMRIEDYGYAPLQGGLSVFVSIFTFPLLGGGVFNLVKAYRSSRIYEERNRILYLLIAIMFPVIGAFLDSATNLPPMLVWGQVIFVMICSISIVLYHLLDIRIFFRKGLAYLIISTLVAVPYAFILFSLNNIIDLKTEEWWYHALIILLLSVALQPLQQWAQRLIDKAFYRDRYDHLMSLENLSRETQSILNIDELCSKLMTSLSGALRISKGCLLLRSIDNSGFVINYCMEMPGLSDKIIFSKDCLFVNWLETHGTVVTSRDFNIIPQLQSLTPDEETNIEKLDARIFVPISIKGNELSGILALGDKIGQGAYSIEDKQLIVTVANQMAVSLENARLFNSERRMRETYEKMDTQKTEFLHNVAHELKTPLTALLSSSEILDEESPDDKMILRRLYGNIRRSAEIMNRRVNELLELARMQIGETKFSIAPVEISPLILDTTSQLIPLFDNNSQKLTIDVPEDLPVINADKDKIQQVLTNILSNANKYSPPGSKIHLKACVKSGSILVQVFDEAPRISEENKMRIFEPYYRVDDNLVNKDSPGLGLGLALSKNFISLHNGKIWVEDNPDGGNIFSFTLPINNKQANST